MEAFEVVNVQGGVTWPRAVFTAIANMAGVGVLGLPSSLAQSGWSGLILLVLTCIMECYTGKILIYAMNAEGRTLRTYQDIGRAAFGEAGYMWTLVFQNLTLLFVTTLFLILAGKC